jgi:hypothetical protein
MILDLQELFSGTVASNGARTGQAISASGLSTNVLDRTGAAVQFPTLQDEGISGPDVFLVVNVGQAFNNLTSLQIEIISDSNSNLVTSPVSHVSVTLLLALLTAGATPARIQLPSDNYKQFVGLRYTVNGTAPTTGTLFAFLTHAIQRNVIYPTALPALDV